VVAGLAVASLLFSSGCVTGWPAPPSEEERAAFGDMALVVSPEFETDFPRPVSGWSGGLGMGFLRGLGAIVALAVAAGGEASKGGHGDGAGVAAFIGAALGAAMGVVYTPISMVAGAITAPPGDEVDLAEGPIRRVVENPDLPRVLADAFEVESGRTFVPPDQATTLVELRLVCVGRGSAWDWISFDRPFEVVIEAGARVVRPSDGEVIWEADRTLPIPGGEPVRRTYVEWSEGGARALEEAVNEAVRSLGRSLSHSIFHQRETIWWPEPGDGGE
jgi:hypothetical protein